MDAPAFTPGPWGAFYDDENDNTNIVSFTDKTRFVCCLPGRHKDEPDARLISAAPEMRAMLECAFVKLSDYINRVKKVDVDVSLAFEAVRAGLQPLGVPMFADASPTPEFLARLKAEGKL